MNDIVERLKRNAMGYAWKFQSNCLEAAEEIERLQKRLAEAERDAARYRWLRTVEASWYCDGERLTLNQTPAVDAAFGRTLDQVIDIAMRAADSAPLELHRRGE